MALDPRSGLPERPAFRHPAVKGDALVNSGALKLAVNVLRRAGKSEVADELELATEPLQDSHVMGSFWSMLKTCESHADEPGPGKVLERQMVEGWFVQWNALTGQNHTPAWKRRAS